jgi:hypothetical protein
MSWGMGKRVKLSPDEEGKLTELDVDKRGGMDID